jgi:ribose/xylose/arabinose/galactoside ABC-type transport system permease subunit
VEEPRPLPELARSGVTARRARDAVFTYVGVLTVLVILVAFFSVNQPRFFTIENLWNVLDGSSILLIVSVGLTFTMLASGFDLSLSGVLALGGVFLWVLLSHGLPLWLAIPAVLLCGVAFGAVATGFAIAFLDVSFFVVTLGVLVATRGLASVIANGESKGLYDNTTLRSIGNGRVGQISYPVIIALVVLALAIFVTRYTGFGRMLYAVGGNPEAARLAGINVRMVRLSTYAISAGLAAFAGIIEAGRLAAASPDADTGIEFTAAAAVLLGGTSFVGGVGTMLGTFLGVLFLGVLKNGLIISSISVYWQGVITGAVLFASVMIDRFRRRRVS